MHTLRPRGDEYDEAMRKLFGYVEDQIAGVDSNPDQAVFFDRAVSDQQQLAAAVVSAAQQVQAAVIDRGRDQFGRKGDYFWDGAVDIEEQRRRPTTRLGTYADRSGVPVETWSTQVISYKG